MKKYILALIIVTCFIPSSSSSKDLYEEQLNRGIKNTEPYSYVLIEAAKENKENALTLLREAQKYSPDLPATYFEIARHTLSVAPGSFFEAVDSLLQGIAAYKKNFWWSFMLMSSLLTSIILSLLASLLVIITIRLPRDLPLFSHDIGEEKSKMLLLLVLVSAVFGPVFLLGGLLLLICWYHHKWDRMVFVIYVFFLLTAPWFFKAVSTVFSASASAPLKAVVQVNESRDNTYALSVLSNSQDPAEIFSYALALKREGRYHDAIQANERLIAMSPDAKAYINLANNYVALHNIEKAIDLYKKSLQLAQIPSAFYNLSQVYRETLDFERGEEYFLSAQKLDSAAVSRYRSLYSRNPNRFVIDETLPMESIFHLAKAKTKGTFTAGLSHIPLSLMPLIGILFGGFYILANKFFKTWSYRCSRCGKILCTKCERHLLWGRMCPQCYQSLIKLDELDAKERISRLLKVYEHQNKRRKIIKTISLIVPGSGLVYGGNILYGFFFLWIFLFSAFLLITTSFFKAGMAPFAHVWLNIGAIMLMAADYILSIMTTRRRLAKGWL